MRGRIILVFSTVIQLFLWSVLGLAQIISSSLVGRVTDSSGAPVPNITVLVKNSGTGSVHAVVTNASGTYIATNLQPGIYDISVKANGFRELQISGIRLQAAQTVRENLVLEVGQVRQVVSVKAKAPLLRTDSGTIGGTLNELQITSLPNSMQSIDTLEGLVPGAQTQAKEQPLTGGARYWGGSNFTLNGVPEQDNFVGRGATSVIGLEDQPPPSSLQEFKVESANANAEFRAVTTIMLVTKAGSNQFHGQAYEDLQNTAFNANSFLSNAAGNPRPVLNWNQFGANLGGPIWRNKMFFFVNYSGFRRRQDRTVQFNFPSTAMLKGDFSSLCSTYANGICSDPNGTQLYNPFTGNPFPNNQIPSNLITPQAQTLLKYLPRVTNSSLPGAEFGNPNYFGIVPLAYDRNSIDTRVDYSISDADKLWVVYSRNTTPLANTYLGYPANYGNGSNFGDNTYNYSLTETHILNPRTINELRLGYFDMYSIRSGENGDFDPRSLFPQLPKSPQRGLPTMTMLGYTGMFHDYGYNQVRNHVPTWNIRDDVTFIRGNHTFKVGADLSRFKGYGPNPNAPLPTFNFNGQWTGNKGWPGHPQSAGNSFADFLLGVASSSSKGLPGIEVVMSDNDEEFYAQDTWQARPKLTINYGIRYMYQAPWDFRGNTRSTIDLVGNKLVLPQNSVTAVFPGYGASAALFAAYPFETTRALGWPINYIEPDVNNWGPRFGFAYRLQSGATSATVLRGGYGVYYNLNPGAIGPRSDTSNPPWTTQYGGSSATTETYNSQLPGNPTTPYLPDITFQDPFPASLSGSPNVAANPTIYMTQRDFKNPVTQEWNLTLEHQFASSWMARASYVGNQAHHVMWYNSDINVPTQQIPNTPIQNQRPLQPWSSILATRSGAKQNFNQLQLELRKEFSGGLLLQVEYQWTRSLDNAPVVGGPQNWNFPSLDYGNSDYVRRHVFIVNYVYQLPIGRGRRWLRGANPVVEGLVGGWQVSGITTYETGLPFTVNFAVPSNYIGWWGGRANLVSGSSVYSTQNRGSHDVTSGVQWFNPAAFSAPTPWTWGDSQRNYLFGPGYANWDISVAKSFHLPGLAEHAIDFHADFFDAFNHFNLGNPSATVAAVQYGGSPISSTGKIFGGSDNRVLQLGMRYRF